MMRGKWRMMRQLDKSGSDSQHGAWRIDLWRIRRGSEKLNYKKVVDALGKRLRILLRNYHCKMKLRAVIEDFPLSIEDP
ncbi:hypothetical protein L195_g033326 [Trifolium pratense]|uniref:Uncharacterized protein n=1 Tax=Trifolium pratense TaxID=57577 RepID=A0A2K3LFP5_TRIPR|nr:hypothetical protein L195_g033326 [Trifolium pratense]